MSDLFRVKRGQSKNRPNLMQGEICFDLDTEELYVGGINGNVKQPTEKEITQIDVKLNDVVNLDDFSHLKYRGLTLVLTDEINNDTFYDSIMSKVVNVNGSLVVVTPEYVNDSSDPNVTTDSNITDKLNRLFAKCSQYNVKISMLKPHIVTYEEGDSYYRGNYNPSDKTLFFAKWNDILLSYASICKAHNIDLLSIACEMIQLTDKDYFNNWQTIINNVKIVNPTLIVTAALKTQSENRRDIQYKQSNLNCFSELLDIIGINAYTSISRNNPKVNFGGMLLGDGTTTVVSVNDVITQNKIVFNKNTIITEIGCTVYSDSTSAIINPINTAGEIDRIDQNTYLNVALDVFTKFKSVTGIVIWSINDPFSFFNGVNSTNTISKYFHK